jgi:serine/threonine-protein kinase haspin
MNVHQALLTHDKPSNQESTTSKYKDQTLSNLLASWEQKLDDRLNKILELLDLENGRDDMCCAADLVAYAIDQHWLSERDFFLS